jgi:hypothetical protein
LPYASSSAFGQPSPAAQTIAATIPWPSRHAAPVETVSPIAASSAASKSTSALHSTVAWPACDRRIPTSVREVCLRATPYC